MAVIEFRNVSKIYGKEVRAVDELNLTIQDGEFTVVVGPSGCGKSTVLRLVAGLEEISTGEIIVDGDIINHIPPQKREAAMVFQSYALYPHLTVYENMAFPLRIKKKDKQSIDRRVREVAQSLGLLPLISRMPRELSGGQKQRVALGRAMVREPNVFLFDEPLSNLDAALRSEMRVEIAELHSRLAANFIYVTHDQVEAVTLGQKIIVLKNGKLQQYGSPDELYRYPANTFVAGFIGSPPMNFLTLELRQVDGRYVATSGNLQIPLHSYYTPRLDDYGKQKLTIGIRPKDLFLNCFTGRNHVDDSCAIRGSFLFKESIGDEILYYFDLTPDIKTAKPFIVKETSSANFNRKENISILIHTKNVYLFDADSGNALLKNPKD